MYIYISILCTRNFNYSKPYSCPKMTRYVTVIPSSFKNEGKMIDNNQKIININ